MNQPKKRISALLSAALALLLLFPITALADESDDNGTTDKIASLNSQYKDLQAAQNKITAELGKVKGEKEKQVAVKAGIVRQVHNTIAQIDVLADRISLLEENIADKEAEMSATQDEIDRNFGLLKTRMRAMYMSGGNAGTIGLVLGADSYSQFLMRAEMVNRIAKHDQDLIDKLAAEKDALDTIKKEIESNKADTESDKSEMTGKRTELDAQVAVAQDKIQDISATEQAFLSDKAAMQKQMARLQSEISKIYAEINKTSTKIPYVGGVMRWPSDTLTQVSSDYGMRGSDNHTGVDIAGPGAFGTPVLAANGGTVAIANLSFIPGRDYGKYVIIDHGNGIQTLYGHCSALNVTVGQVVAKGEKIAEVGMTGWATGPHIHFEVRKNGVYQDPTGWL